MYRARIKDKCKIAIFRLLKGFCIVNYMSVKNKSIEVHRNTEMSSFFRFLKSNDFELNICK